MRRVGSEAKAALFEADVALAPDHQVVEHVDVQQLARLHDLARDGDVLGRGRGVAAGVVG